MQILHCDTCLFVNVFSSNEVVPDFKTHGNQLYGKCLWKMLKLKSMCFLRKKSKKLKDALFPLHPKSNCYFWK